MVGLSHLFRSSADTSGIKLKKLATFLGMCCENEYRMSEVLLRRESNIPVDGNAVSVFIPNPEEFSLGGKVYLLTRFCNFFYLLNFGILSRQLSLCANISSYDEG